MKIDTVGTLADRNEPVSNKFEDHRAVFAKIRAFIEIGLGKLILSRQSVIILA